MERIRRFLRKFGKGLKAKGYTLVEVAAVVAVSATLAAVVVPIAIDKTTEGKIVAAKQDCQAIGGAIAGFYKDVGYWPAFDGTYGDFDTTPYTGSAYRIKVLRSGSETEVLGGAAHDPINATLFGTTLGYSAEPLERHLVVDQPGGYAPYGYRNAKLNWKGPYIDSLAKKRDPWGNNYLVLVGAMYYPTSDIVVTGMTYPKIYGWVISAGPNGKLETAGSNNMLKGDDIGFVLFSLEREKG